MTDKERAWVNVNFATNSISDELTDDGFNEYGVREKDDGSVDVIFAAMEPGLRHEGTPFEVEITSQFLRKVASKDYNYRLPMQFSHKKDQRANVGWLKENKIKFSNDRLRLMGHIPNTGSQVRSDVISDFTHDPPAIQDGSVGFDPRSLKVEHSRNRKDPAKFTDAKLMEFSLTPFPAGYDNGGLSPNFSEIIEDSMTPTWGESRLTARRI
ncbi:hypothetical protein ACFQL7_20900 [Halocatena marina]|uniref:Uncharacterized protein n=1 Tax=Halocatena marina TaxID=2934937 RepID=A0ABD5YS56_9EURY|nr:hypothetical protein [Halocatena marina]